MSACAKKSSCDFIPSCESVFVQKYIRANLCTRANLTATRLKRDTFKIYPVKFENRLAIENRGNSDSKK